MTFTETEIKDVLTALYQDAAVDLVLAHRVAALIQGRAVAPRRWIVVVGQGSWAKCHGPFASYDDCIDWAKRNQFTETDSYQAYPVNAVPAVDPPPDGTAR